MFGVAKEMIDLIGQAFAYIVVTFFFFIVVMALKYAILRNNWRSNTLAKIVWYVVGGKFLYRDAIADIIMTIPFLQLPKHYGEDLTVTARCKAVKNYTHNKTITQKLTKLDIWRYGLATWICRHLNNVEQAIGGKDHC
jgi:hypothetical protein